jgi:ABC-type branched-subunit amino acid transport system ATPase component
MIEIEDVTVLFGGVKGLSELSATLESNVTGLIGPNGAGKTTLLNVFSGFVRPREGRVFIDNLDILKLAPHRRAGVGLRRTFQTEQTVDSLTVRENVEAAADHLTAVRSQQKAQVDGALDYVGLAGGQGRLARDLNAYERRRLEISRCLIGEPKLIMMDEPGAGLAAAEAERLRALIAGAPGYCGAQVLLVDHDVDLIAAICETTLVLDFGRKIAFGPTAAVLADPAVRAAYLGVTEEKAA